MALKDKKTTAKSSSATTKVTRIRASDDTKTKKAVAPKKEKRETVPKGAGTTRRNPLRKAGTPFIAIGTYFKGAWYELKQVRWPDRGATWGMTGALLGFTAFFVVFILLLDALFKYLFQLILG